MALLKQLKMMKKGLVTVFVLPQQLVIFGVKVRGPSFTLFFIYNEPFLRISDFEIKYFRKLQQSKSKQCSI